MRKVIRVLKTPVTMLALLAILGYGAVWGYKQATIDTTKPDVVCVMQDVGPTLTPDKVTIRVMNGGTQGGHAKRTRTYMLAFDFKVIHYGNADRQVETTTVVGHAATDPEVLLVAKMFNGAVTEGDGRIDHIVDVIVPTKFQEYDNPQRPSVPVTGPVCLPVLTSAATPTDSASPSASATPTASTTPSKKK